MFERLKILRSSIALVRDPRRLDDVFEAAEALGRSEDLTPMIEAIRGSSATAAAAFEERPRIDRNELGALAPGTLGRAFADHLRNNELDPGVFLGRPGATDAEFALAHLYETHDVWHVVTGFATDVAGELGLQAFYVSQFPGKLGKLLIALGLLNGALYEPEDVERRVEAISAGWRAGRRARPLFGIDWSALWHHRLDDLQRGLDLLPSEGDLAAAAS
jgi:ubiquinone biosynthesis protein COQ4